MISLLLEDPALLVVNKPANLHSVKNNTGNPECLAAWLEQNWPGCATASDNAADGGLVQRLDYETSGAILAARIPAVWLALYRQLRQGDLQKRYLAVVEGHFNSEVELNNFIGSPYRRAHKVRVYQQKPAEDIRALSAFSKITPRAYSAELDLSLIEVEAHCARRHQVRAHCASCGHPLAGDKLYGSSRFWHKEENPAHPKFILHAHWLKFQNPVTCGYIEITAPSPIYLLKLFPASSEDCGTHT